MTIRKIAITAITAVSMAGLLSVATVQPAAASHKFWHVVAGGIVAGVVINELARNRSHNHSHHSHSSQWDAHVEWCYDHKPRYRVSDNTYRRIGQHRRTCTSPFVD